MRRTWLFLYFLLTGGVLYGQSGPYPMAGFPPDSLWTAFDSLLKAENGAAAFIWQPQRTTPLQGVVLSPGGLALFPSALLDSSQQRSATWLGDPAGLPLITDNAGQLAILLSVEDLTEEVLAGIPDSIPPAARSVRAANRMLPYRQAKTPPHTLQYIRSLYEGNRYYRYTWVFHQARLLGQIVAPAGASFALLRLQPISDQHRSDYAHFPLASEEVPPGQIAYIGGMQTFPSQILPPCALQTYYTELQPLIEEARHIITTTWQDQERKPDWLTRTEAADELEMPLSPLADPTLAFKMAQEGETALLTALGEDREAWVQYQERSQRLEAGYQTLSTLLLAQKLSLDIIPTRLQLFRLVNFLLKWRENAHNYPQQQDRLATSMRAFLTHFYASFDPETDQAAAAALFELYLKKTRYDLQSPFALEQWLQMEKDTRVLAAALYQKSGLTDPRHTMQRMEKDPGAFLRQLPDDYAFQFIQNWLTEHRQRITGPLRQLEESLKEERRRMIKGILQYAPAVSKVEKGGLSFTRLGQESLPALAAHYLSAYPVGSPVLSTGGKLIGLTYCDDDNPFLLSRSGNRVFPMNLLLRILHEQFPNHPVARELLEGK